MSRLVHSNAKLFPYRKDAQGRRLCRVCGKTLSGRRTSFCGRECLRDFFMGTDWKRVRRVVYERDGGICMICGSRIRRHQKFHVDHIVPLSKGGAEFDLTNLQLACPQCNLYKGAKTVEPEKYEEPDDPVLAELIQLREELHEKEDGK